MFDSRSDGLSGSGDSFWGDGGGQNGFLWQFVWRPWDDVDFGWGWSVLHWLYDSRYDSDTVGFELEEHVDGTLVVALAVGKVAA